MFFNISGKKFDKTRKHCSMMHTAQLPTIHGSVTTRCQYWWRWVTWNEQVWTGIQSCHQMSLAEGALRWASLDRSLILPPDVPSRGGAGGVSVQWGPMSVGRTGGPCTVGCNVSWPMVTWTPPNGQKDTHEWQHYLPATSLADSNNSKNWTTWSLRQLRLEYYFLPWWDTVAGIK